MKKRLAILFGGRSAEHEVSAESAANIYNAVDRDEFDVILVGVNKSGEWKYNSSYNGAPVDRLDTEQYFNQSLTIRIDTDGGRPVIIDKEKNQTVETFDIAFPIIHGTFGEDGTLQGLLKSLGIPFVGPDILGSALCMDKDITKRVLRDGGIPVADGITVYRHESNDINFAAIEKKFGLPFFVKPCNAGSSVGVSKIENEAAFRPAIENAFRYDNKILIEEAVTGKEVECAVLGNETPEVSVVGEIIPTKDFYSYEAKYLDADGARMKIPADIDEAVSTAIRTAALRAFRLTGCEGMARIDFFLRPDNTFVLNELNTLPGFTAISMYPKLFTHTGIPVPQLITRLVALALERASRDKLLETAL